MATYAMMSGNVVSNIIVADNKEETEVALNCVLIEYTPENPAGTGYIYDESTNKFTAPEVVELSAMEKLFAAGLSEEEIAALIQEAGSSEPTP
jgi:hypothetical protein